MAIAPLVVNKGAPQAGNAETATLHKAAREFEALLLERILASGRPDQTGPAADWRSMADRQFAADLAAQSPLGIAKLLESKP